MKKFSTFVVKNRKWFLIAFAVFLVAGIVGSFFVETNFSDVVYLPDDSEVSIGLEKMYGAFGEGGNASTMVTNLTYQQAIDFKTRMEGTEGVKSVIWLDDLFFGMEIGGKTIIHDAVAATEPAITEGEAISYLLYVLSQVNTNQVTTFLNEKLLPVLESGGIGGLLAASVLLTGETDSLTYYLTVNLSPETERVKAKAFLDAVIGQAISVIITGEVEIEENFDMSALGEMDLNEVLGGLTDQLGLFYTTNNDGTINALYQLSFKGSDYADSTVDAIGAIRGYNLPNGNSKLHFIGNASNTYNSIQAMNSETTISMIVAGIVVIVILLLTTTAYWEPILLLLTIGTAILMNMGTDMLVGYATGVGAISYMTKGVSSVLILALTMDYSIFLLHRFKQERKNHATSEEAMITALSSSFSAISSSSLTTIASFVALMFMSYTLGLDMGLVLAKGVIFSICCVFFLMPGLILYTEKLIDKTEHKTFNMTFKKFSKFLVKTRFYLPFIIIALIIPCTIFQAQNSFVYGPEASMGGEESIMTQDLEAVENAGFGRQNQAIVLIPYDWVTDAETSGAKDPNTGAPCSTEYKLTMDLMNFKVNDSSTYIDENGVETNYIKAVQSYSLIAQQGMIDMMPDKFISQFIPATEEGETPEYARVVIFLNVPEEGATTTTLINAIQQLLDENYSDAVLLGQSSATLEIKGIVTHDYDVITYVSIGLVALILIVTFKAALIPVILIVIIQGSVYINMVFPYIMGDQMVYIGYMLVSSILLGATIDYAILLTTRYMAHRKSMNKYDAVQHALADSSRTLITSASILAAVGAAVMLVSSLPATQVIGGAVFRGGICAFVMVMIPLPQLLILLDKPIMYTTWKGKYNMIDNKAASPAPEIAEPAVDPSAADKVKSGRKKYKEMTKEEREEAIIANILHAVDDPEFDPDDEDL